MAEPRTIRVEVGTADVPMLVYEPRSEAPGPAVVLSPEAFGINKFTKEVASKLSGLGYVVVVPDYYHGNGLRDPESYTDFTEVLQFIDVLDFGQGAHDIMAGVEYARALPSVDPERVAVWGYCTGGTLAMLAASLDRRLGAAVLFFPSQPTFPELTSKRPVQPIDLLWNVSCPVLLLVGEEDKGLMDLLPEIRQRGDQWAVDLQVETYPGAGHAFSAPVPPLRHDAADKASWADATSFLGRTLGPGPAR